MANARLCLDCIFKLYTNVDAVGNAIPVSQVREDVAVAYRKEIWWQTSEKLLPFKKMFAQRKVQPYSNLNCG